MTPRQQGRLSGVMWGSDFALLLADGEACCSGRPRRGAEHGAAGASIAPARCAASGGGACRAGAGVHVHPLQAPGPLTGAAQARIAGVHRRLDLRSKQCGRC